MAAPRFSPVPPTERPRYYESPDHVPEPWTPDRPGDIDGFQPSGPQLGAQGPDQGFALRIASRLRPKLQLQGEHVDDVIRGCLGVALRRASLYSRAPVVHDLDIAFTIWGFYDADPPAELVELRQELFEGLRLVGHHYTEARLVADMVPESTLRMTPGQAASAYPADWRRLVGA
ncbi:MAG TPA: hypothetical protein VK860_12075 [Ilumatobacteraceae bacterium]|nr:hypothetical protein [Ilumatobacteraceae bacterium]